MRVCLMCDLREFWPVREIPFDVDLDTKPRGDGDRWWGTPGMLLAKVPNQQEEGSYGG